MTAGEQRRAAFGQALRLALDERSSAWLGAEIARLIGQESPVTASAVNQWLTGKTEPTPDKVFAAEKILGRPLGSLSRLLGYLPVEAKAPRSVLDAIDNDPKLSDRAREMLRASYRAAVHG